MNFWQSFSNLFKEQLALIELEATQSLRNLGAGHHFKNPKNRRERATSAKPRRQKNSKIKNLFEPPTNIDLSSIWRNLVAAHFPQREDLLKYKINWSRRRQTRVLASCNIRKLLVNVAQEMSQPECQEYLSSLIYHEMCHAVLGDKIGRIGTKRMWHGPQFKALEMRHPEIPKLDNWIKTGGWTRAVRSFRTRQYHKLRKLQTQLKIQSEISNG